MCDWKTVRNGVRYGIMAAALVHVVWVSSCWMQGSSGGGDRQSDNPGFPLTDGLQVPQIKSSALSIEKAFASGDPEAVKGIMTNTAIAQFGAEIDSANWLPQFAKAFSNRQLTAYSSLYAEYEFLEGKTRYSVAMQLEKDGIWKLARY